MRNWIITCKDGNSTVWTKTVSGLLSENQIIRLLERLACKDLSIDEIIGASLGPGDSNRNGLLDKIGVGHPIVVGEYPTYYAEKDV